MADPNPSKLSQSSLLSDKDMAKFDKSSKTNVAKSTRAVMGSESAGATSKSSASVSTSSRSAGAAAAPAPTAGSDKAQKTKLILAVVFLVLAGVLIAYSQGLLDFQKMADAKKYADPLADIPVEQREEVRKQIEAEKNAPPPPVPPAAS